MRNLLSIARIREIELALFRSEPSYGVMRRAATAVAEAAAGMLPVGGRAVSAAGSGNNGGDAVVAAQLLCAQGFSAQVWLPLGKPRAGSDAAKAFADYLAAGGSIVSELPVDLADNALIIDGLFGIGLSRDLGGAAAAAVDAVNASRARVLAVDVPSGIVADTGAVLGRAVRADATVTFFAGKAGLHTLQGPDHAGRVDVAGLGADCGLLDTDGTLVGQALFCARLRRRIASHKGSHGSLAVVGGSAGMTGALVLATRAAVAHGAGKVHALCLSGNAPAFDPQAPEVMWRDCAGGGLPDFPDGMTALAVGVGMGRDADPQELLDGLRRSAVPMVVDADALNLLSGLGIVSANWQNGEVTGSLFGDAEAVLTPHPAEAARLAGTSTREIQRDRVAAARKLARAASCVVLLKGAGTVVADRSGRWAVIGAASAALAQAGSGDQLTGIVGALVAQGLDCWEAACDGAWLHAAGAEAVQKRRGGPHGVRLAEVEKESTRLLARAASL